MTEAGGPSCQSGVFFQNTIAARYLGRLCDPSERPASHEIVSVRVEAPGHVDDIVATYRDGHRDWVSAKERLDPSGPEFEAVWRAFALQRRSAGFGAADWLVLLVGSIHGTHEALIEITERAATSLSPDEWRSRLTKQQTQVVAKLEAILQPVTTDELWPLIARVKIEITSLSHAERQMPDWLPRTNQPKQTLMRLLRDRVGGHARVRREFSRDSLIVDLKENDDVQIADARAGESVYADTLARRYDQILVPGTSIVGPTDELYVEPRLRVLPQTVGAQRKEQTAFHEEELFERDGARVGLEALDGETKTIVIAPAGFGKTELVRALSRRYVRAGLLPAVVTLADVIARDVPLITYLHTAINESFACTVEWAAASERGRVVVLLDGLDELGEHPRSVALKRLKEFSARFPRAGWVLTVRDANALHGVAEATMLGLEPWHDEQRLELIGRFLGRHDQALAEPLALRLASSPELDRMARVPLFLALLVEESRNAGAAAISLRRSDLLLHYIDRLLSSANEADKRPITNSKRTLIDAAELLAAHALEAATTDLAERAAVTELATMFGPAADSLIADLVSTGLLRSTRGRVRFVFPLVQEYLAGRSLGRRRSPQELSESFRAAATRPWAQALRFALEELDDADVVARALLDVPDDAFHSATRALGQCVADGARVSRSTRDELGERLGKLWVKDAVIDRRLLTSVIATAFSSPLPTTVRNAIQEGHRLDYGAGALLSAAQDDELTRTVLRRRPLPLGFKLGDSKRAMSRIADEVADTCLEWLRIAKGRPHPAMDAGWIGSVIRDLDGLTETARRRISTDDALHPAVRLGALLLRPGDFDNSAVDLVDRALDDILADDHPIRTFHFELVEEALWRLPRSDAEALWIKRVLDDAFPSTPRSILVSGVGRYRSSDEALALLETLPPSASIWTATEIVKAWLGRRESMVLLTEHVAHLDDHGLRGWGMLISRYLEADLVVRGLQQLEQRALGPAEYHEVAHKVWFPLVHDIESADPMSSPQGRYRRLHPAAPDAALMFHRWALRADDAEGAQTLCMTISLDLGHEPARSQLLEHVARARRKPLSFKEDYALGWAVKVLSRSDGLPTTVLEQLAALSDSNLRFAVHRSCASHPSQESLELLLREDQRLGGHVRDHARGALRTVAIALGVRIEERGGTFIRT